MIFSWTVILLEEVLTIVLELVMLEELVVIDVDPVVILVEVFSALWTITSGREGRDGPKLLKLEILSIKTVNTG